MCRTQFTNLRFKKKKTFFNGVIKNVSLTNLKYLPVAALLALTENG
jgi:hypothetical protein